MVELEENVLYLYKRCDKEFYCELTNKMNKCLRNASAATIGDNSFFGAYLYDYGDRKEFDGQEGYIYSIRLPGATRGGIFLNTENVITEIHLDIERCKCFNDSVHDLVKKYIGYKIDRRI